jgi:hypothetical protein
VVRELAPHQIPDQACTHLRAVLDWLRERHGIAPVRAEFDIKSVILTIDYDERLTPAALAEAALAFGSSTDLTFDERGFSCQTDWQSAGVPRAEAEPGRKGWRRLLDVLRWSAPTRAGILGL